MLALQIPWLLPTRLANSLQEIVTPGRIVALGFTTLLVATCIYLYRTGLNIPIQDEWDLTLQLLQVGYGLEWICLPHNEHRFIVGRAIWGLGLVLSGYDFRVGGWVTLSMLAISAAWLVWTARSVRGSSSLADLIVPAILLNAGHCFNLAMGYQIGFTSTVLSGTGLIVTALRVRQDTAFRTGLHALLWLMVIAGNGGFGLGFAPAIVAWILFTAWQCFREVWWKALVLLAGTAILMGFFAWSLLTLPSNPDATSRPGLLSFVEVACGYCGAGLGAALTDTELNDSGWVPAIVAIVVIVELLALARLTHVIACRPQERPRAIGLLAVLGGHFAVALGIAMTRNGALVDRYVTPASVGLLVVWATGICYGPRTAFAWLGSIALVVMAAIGIAIANSSRHDIQDKLIRASIYQMQQDVRAGMPLNFLEGKYAYSYGVLMQARLGMQLRQFQKANVGPFAAVAAEPEMRSLAVSGVPSPWLIPTWHEGRNIPDDALRLTAPAGHIYGLRLQFEQPWVESFQSVHLFWRDPSGKERNQFAFGPFFPASGSLAIWIDGSATDVRLVRRGSGEGLRILHGEWLVK